MDSFNHPSPVLSNARTINGVLHVVDQIVLNQLNNPHHVEDGKALEQIGETISYYREINTGGYFKK